MDVNRISLHVPIPETDLREFSNVLGAFFRDESNLANDNVIAQWLEEFVWALISTAATPGLKPTHRVAACNVLCGSIEQCSDHSLASVRALAFSERTCKSLLDIFLDRYESAKAKSMKQVLTTLIKILAKALNLLNTPALRDQAVIRQLEVLFFSLDHVKAKPALYGLTLFLSRKLITRHELLTIFRQRSGPEVEGSSIDPECLSAFMKGILTWTCYQDVAPAIGQFLSNFLSEAFIVEEASATYPRKSPPWTSPLLQILQQNVDCLQALKNYVFPPLFKSNINDYWQFLQFLRIEENLGLEYARLENDIRSSSQHQRNILLFSSLQVGKDLGLVQEQDSLSCPGISVLENRIQISDVLLGRLLEHTSHAVRIAGLELLLNSPSSTRPFTKYTLRSIQDHLPQMMADPDSNFRGQLLSLLKLFVDRLRSITSNQFRALELQEQIAKVPNAAQKVTSLLAEEELRRLDESLKAHERAVYELVSCFSSELHPNASYQSHISAIKGIIIVAKSGLDSSVHEKFWSKQAKGDINWPFSCFVLDESSHRALVDLLLDPFDDVRQASLTALKMLNSKETAFDEASAVISATKLSQLSRSANVISKSFTDSQDLDLHLAMQRAYDIMLESGRIDHADGIGRLFDLLTFKSNHRNGSCRHQDIRPVQIAINIIEAIEDAIHVAQSSLATAVAKQPIHGLFISLRYVLESVVANPNAIVLHDSDELQKMSYRIHSVVSDIWKCVRPLLCNDAPEGYIPIELENQAEITTRDVLSYAWRALKESSLLLRVAMDLDSLCHTLQVPSVPLEDHGNLCFLQLSELRHRGAFSTVSQTFSLICENASVSAIVADQCLIMKWYNMILDLIRKNGTVTTRRSAGIPSLMVAVLSADKTGKLFEQSIEDLMELAQSEVAETKQGAIDLPQVHTLNSLKLMFTSPKLGQNSEPYIVDVLNLVAKNISSKTWAIRNCSLMLFRSLIDRLLGSHESMDDASHPRLETNSRLSYESYPGLLNLIMAFLSQVRSISGSAREISESRRGAHGNATKLAETIFPVLDLLRRAAPPEAYRDEIRTSVLVATSASHWHVRDMAARTFASLVPQSQLVEHITLCLECNTVNVNQIHGKMMCVLQILRGVKKVFDENCDFGKLSAIASSVFSAQLHKKLLNPLLEAAWFDILNALGEMILSAPADRGNGSARWSSKLVKQYEVTCTLSAKRILETLTRLGSSNLIRSILLNKAIRGLIHMRSDMSSSELSMCSVFDESMDMDDSNGTLYVIDSLSEILKSVDLEIKHLVTVKLCGALDRCKTPEIRSSLEQLLVQLLDEAYSEGQLKHWIDVRSSLTNIFFKEDISHIKTPLQMESSIDLWGYCLGSRWQTEDESLKLGRETRSWITVIRTSLDSFSEFSTRYSAASSIRNLARIEGALQEMEQELLISLAFTVADVLVDDDDEIRDIGSEAAIGICDGTIKAHKLRQVVPPTAKDLLAKYIIEHFRESNNALREALIRLVGQDSGDNSFLAVNSRASLALTRDTSLFSKEKQNLYLNEAREAYFWSSLLKKMKPGEASHEMIKAFSKWVSEGLEDLKNIAEQNYDGPLGWSSTPDVFALITRVVHSADVVSSWKAKVVTDRSCTIRRLLCELGEAGKRANLHGMFSERIAYIVQNSLLEKRQTVKGVVSSVDDDQ